MKKIILCALMVVTGFMVRAQKLSIIPRPVSEKVLSGSFIISPDTHIVFSNNTSLSAAFLNNYLDSFYHFKIKRSAAVKGNNRIILKLSARFPDTTIGAYRLNCENGKIVISSHNAQGVFYGIQTLIQLLPTSSHSSNSLVIPNVAISDAPRFGYRGMMLDVGRHFMPVGFVKQFIDYMALHKMNTFHWHLTEDQGWRIEIKRYPRLTQVGGWREGTVSGKYPHWTQTDHIKTGGFYTQEEIKAVVKYAAERYITIIPEIDMPGHSSAAIAAYPALSCFPDSSTSTRGLNWSGPTKGKLVQQTWGVFKDVYAPTPYTFHFLENVLDEVMALFPSKYIHIGGDECPKIYWKQSAYCQNLIKEKGLKNEEGLQSYFISTIEKYLNSKGRQIIGWDEILEGGLAPNATVQSWRGEQGGINAAKLHHKVIMSPSGYLYLPHPQMLKEDSITAGGYLPIKKVYNYDPVGKMDSATQHYVIGAESCLWTEYMKTPAKVEYMLFPRMAAVSEVLWTSQHLKDYASFLLRLNDQINRYKFWDINYCRKYTVE